VEENYLLLQLHHPILLDFLLLLQFLDYVHHLLHHLNNKQDFLLLNYLYLVHLDHLE